VTTLSVIAFIFGAFGVWLTIRQTVWCWPVSLVAVIASVAEFFNEKLYGDMALQAFYFFAGVYGWIFWKKNSGREFLVTGMPGTWWPWLMMATAAQAIIYFLIINFFGGDRPVLDALLTAASLTATYMMTRKWIENWISWVVIDAVYVYLYGIKEMWLFVSLYLIFTAMAFYGWRDWKRVEKSKGFLVSCSLFLVMWATTFKI
jgi:nicotinamide mononucleotide transporter